MTDVSACWQTLGQERAIDLLQRSLKLERISHAHLFVGPRQVGKMTLALDLARAVNCESGNPPCGSCRSCQRISSGKHSDVRVVSLASAEVAKGKRRTEIGIDDVKEVQEMASLPPFEGKTKVFIIDGAERLSAEAANRLLKTLEEPPPHVMFVLLSSVERAVLPTVISRCQKIELRPMSTEAVQNMLVERHGLEPQRAELLARLSSGCPGWALAALKDDKELERRKQELDTLIEIPYLRFGERLALAAEWAKRFDQSREDGKALLERWLVLWRDLLMLKAGCPASLVNVDYREELERQASIFGAQEIAQSAESVRATMEHIGMNANPRLALDYLLLSVPGKEKSTRAAPAAPVGQV
ncbi:MAG: DNA polymerase III subunit delta' [Dehalococcoidia bacterium]|nr:DNA polymerase III subunit delta' [Dehalococcoidia bacterium]